MGKSYLSFIKTFYSCILKYSNTYGTPYLEVEIWCRAVEDLIGAGLHDRYYLAEAGRVFGGWGGHPSPVNLHASMSSAQRTSHAHPSTVCPHV